MQRSSTPSGSSSERQRGSAVSKCSLWIRAAEVSSLSSSVAWPFFSIVKSLPPVAVASQFLQDLLSPCPVLPFRDESLLLQPLQLLEPLLDCWGGLGAFTGASCARRVDVVHQGHLVEDAKPS